MSDFFEEKKKDTRGVRTLKYEGNINVSNLMSDFFEEGSRSGGQEARDQSIS
jgi:hypothetical protein